MCVLTALALLVAGWVLIPEPAKAVAAVGSPTELMELRSDSSRSFVNADGSLTTEFFAAPRWAKVDGEWVDVDATLTKSGQGWAPRASVVPMAFGDGSLVGRIGSPGRSLTLRWPTALPQPQVVGSTLTYPEVLPGVDLRVEVTGWSFREVWVLKSAAAAKAVRSLVLDVTGDGITLIADGKGGVRGVSPTGATVVRAGAPMMWDAAAPALDGDAASAAPQLPTAAIPSLEEGARAHPVGLQAAASRLSLVPDQKFLQDPARVYPVMVDPDFSVSASSWAMVDQAYPGVAYPNWSNGTSTSPGQGVGYQNYSAWSRKRLLFSFNTSSLSGVGVTRATFAATGVHSATCAAAYPTELWKVDAFGSSTTWNTQPAWRAWQDTRYSRFGYRVSGCDAPTGRVEWSATNAVKDQVAAGQPYTYLGLRAPDENNALQWKRFYNDASLSVTYTRPPSVPYGLGTQNPGVGCGSTVRPWQSPAFQLVATANDPDAGDSQWMTFVVYEGSTAVWRDPQGPYAASPSGVTRTSSPPASILVDGHSYRFTAQVSDGVFTSSESPACAFTVDTSPPTSPRIELPSLTVGADQTAVHATVTTDATATGYVAQLNNSVLPANPAWSTAAATFTLDMPIPAGLYGTQVLYVWVKDSAGNVASAERSFDREVGTGSNEAGWWTFNDVTAPVTSQALSASRTAQSSAMTISAVGALPVDTVPGPSGAPDDRGLRFLPSASPYPQGVASTSGLGAKVTSFSASAKVRVEADPARRQVAITDGSGFEIAVRNYTDDLSGDWTVRQAIYDILLFRNGASPVELVCQGPAKSPDEFTTLTGGLNLSGNEIFLFVDNQRCTATTGTADVTAIASALVIGQAHRPSPADHADPFLGSLDDVRTFPGAVSVSKQGEIIAFPGT